MVGKAEQSWELGRALDRKAGRPGGRDLTPKLFHLHVALDLRPRLAPPATSHTRSHPWGKAQGGWGASYLHAGHVDTGPDLELGAHLDDPGHTVEQHVVELQETQA